MVVGFKHVILVLSKMRKLMIIVRGIYTVLYSRAAKTQSTLQGLIGDFFMVQVAAVTIPI